jgi:hypothetical protein
MGSDAIAAAGQVVESARHCHRRRHRQSRVSGTAALKRGVLHRPLALGAALAG